MRSYKIQTKTKEVKIPIHPDNTETRTIKIGNEIHLSVDDLKGHYGKEIRLLHLFNIKIPQRGNKAEITSIENKAIPKIQWVSDGVKVKVLMDNADWISGLGEKALIDLKEGDVVQFERFGFVRLDKKTKTELEFWFAHK